MSAEAGPIGGGPAQVALCLRVNGIDHDLQAAPDETLLAVLRARLGLLGTKENCLQGECGACTVLLDGAAVYSCLVLAVMAQGREITTVEGLAAEGRLGDLQSAFLRHGALQCGYCTPGMLVAAEALLRASPEPPDEQAVRAGLSGNLCRCTGYAPIVDAVLEVGRARHGAPVR
jgi:carbon-monoxide dehydrogenase small subunit